MLHSSFKDFITPKSFNVTSISSSNLNVLLMFDVEGGGDVFFFPSETEG